MNKQQFINSYHNAVTWTKANSPALLTGAGIILNATSVILAIRAAKKEEELTKNLKNNLVTIHDKIDNGQLSKEDGKKELRKGYFALAKEYIKLYGPCVATGALGAASALGAHKIHTGREVALVGAYSTLQSAFDKYRENVKTKIGEAEEFDMFNKVEEQKVIENGEEKSKFRMMDDPGDYSYLFDEANVNFTKDGKANEIWLQTVENNMNRLLRRKRYLFLYDVYEALGINLSTIPANKLWASRHIGWIYDPSDSSLANYISFGMHDENGCLKSSRYETMMYGASGIWLTFNPDGDILEGTDTNGKTFMGYAIKAGAC